MQDAIVLITLCLVYIFVVGGGCLAGRGVAALFGKSRVSSRIRIAAFVVGGLATAPLVLTSFLLHAHGAVAITCVVLLGSFGGLTACIAGLSWEGIKQEKRSRGQTGESHTLKVVFRYALVIIGSFVTGATLFVSSFAVVDFVWTYIVVSNRKNAHLGNGVMVVGGGFLIACMVGIAGAAVIVYRFWPRQSQPRALLE
jgi:uncharacterized membrane protein YidH (DUF202 family)